MLNSTFPFFQVDPDLWYTCLPAMSFTTSLDVKPEPDDSLHTTLDLDDVEHQASDEKDSSLLLDGCGCLMPTMMWNEDRDRDTQNESRLCVASFQSWSAMFEPLLRELMKQDVQYGSVEPFIIQTDNSSKVTWVFLHAGQRETGPSIQYVW